MIVWKLTEQHADQVLTALGHRPFLEVNGLIQELLKQAQQQQPAQQVEQPQMQAAQNAAGIPVQLVNGAVAP
jgi:hypothetical protein